MDRMELLNRIKFECDNDLCSIVSEFFDQYMLLYDLLDTVEDISVLATFENSISFQVVYGDIVSSAKLAEKLTMYPYVDIYEKRYNVSFSLSNNTVNITITKMM